MRGGELVRVGADVQCMLCVCFISIVNVLRHLMYVAGPKLYSTYPVRVPG